MKPLFEKQEIQHEPHNIPNVLVDPGYAAGSQFHRLDNTNSTAINENI